MYLLYTDESGSVDDPNGDFFVLTGLSIFERQTHWLDNEMEKIAQRFAGHFGVHDCELHGSPMYTGRGGWKEAATPKQRAQAVVDALGLLDNGHAKIHLFASVIEKRCFADKTQIIPTAFADVAFAFDNSLRAIYAKRKNPQRGVMLFDKSASERMIQDLSRTAKHIGRGNDKLRNFAEVPLFVDSKASRLIQLADLAAYWIYRHYQHGDNRGFNLLYPHVWRDGKESAGLIEHLSTDGQTRKTRAHDFGHPFPPRSVYK